MGKIGQIGAVATILLLVITLVIILWPIGSKILKSAKAFFGISGFDETEANNNKEVLTKPLSSGEVAFERFVGSYEACKKFGSDSCLCDQFEVTTIPEDYSIKLENLGGEKTRIELYGVKPTPEKAMVIDNDNLCFYKYDKSTNKFSEISAGSIVLDKKSNYPYKIYDKVQLFKFDKRNTCFVSGTYETKLFDEITKLQLKCNLKESGIKTSRFGMLDLSDYTEDYPYGSFVQIKDDEASKILENLRTFLLDIGQVTRITRPTGTAQGRLERRQNMFNDAYTNFDRNKDSSINDDVYFISIRGLSLQLKKSEIKKDYFKLHYLEGSEESKILAEKISSRLQELNGKLIFNDKELGIAESDERYGFDFDIIPEANSKGNIKDIGPVFLTCTGSYSNFIACKENNLIPAVFIDIVEVDGDGHYMFEGHYTSISRKIYEGVKDYLLEKINPNKI